MNEVVEQSSEDDITNYTNKNISPRYHQKCGKTTQGNG
jgi:hypothetical protein